MAKKTKYYTILEGLQPGIYDDWDVCKEKIKGFSGAVYKSYKTLDEARKAWAAVFGEPTEADLFLTHNEEMLMPFEVQIPILPPEVNTNAIATDAGCMGNPGIMEYRGVDLQTGQEIFHFGPVWGTNNIGEFLGVVHALALLEKQQRRGVTVYTDSRTAISWVRRRKCASQLPEDEQTANLYNIIHRAEKWLVSHPDLAGNIVRKWETEKWGEIPADFGRK